MLSLPLGWLKNTKRDQWMSQVLCWSDWRGELTDWREGTQEWWRSLICPRNMDKAKKSRFKWQQVICWTFIWVRYTFDLSLDNQQKSSLHNSRCYPEPFWPQRQRMFTGAVCSSVHVHYYQWSPLGEWGPPWLLPSSAWGSLRLASPTESSKHSCLLREPEQREFRSK